MEILLVLLLLCAFGASLGLAGYAWKRRNADWAPAYAVMMCCGGINALLYAAQLGSAGRALELLWRARWTAADAAVLSLLVFTLRYCRPGKRTSWRIVPALAAFPAAVEAAHWLLSPWGTTHGTRGQAYLIWAGSIYDWGLVLSSLILLTRAVLRWEQPFRGQAAILLAGFFAPLLVSVVSTSWIAQGGRMDLTPFAYFLSGLIMAYGLFRYRMLDLKPVARETLIETMGAGMVVVDEQDRIVDLNPAAREFLGASNRPRLGDPLAGLGPPWDRLAQDHAEDARIDLSLPGKDGPARYELRVTRLRDRQRVLGRLLVLHDITERTRMAEAEALRTSQLATLGELTAGVAHEINTPLNTIINSADLMLDAPDRASLEKDVALIKREGRRIAGIVKSLLFYARRGNDEKTPYAVADLLSGALHLVEARLRKDGIGVTVSVPPELDDVVVHPQKIEQVLLNIINNAAFALKTGPHGKEQGKLLEITAGNVANNGPPRVRVRFYDNGPGIPREVIDRVMDPFFTTKPAGQGTGLGLSISQGIVAEHDGTLTIESREGEFTAVVIELPAAGGATGRGGKVAEDVRHE